MAKAERVSFGGGSLRMPAIRSLDEPASLARRITAAIAKPFVVKHTTATFGVAVGIAIARDDNDEADDLMRRVDRALYRLEIEIIETTLVENITVAQALIDQLRLSGVGIALDDFGPAMPR
jgi:predicted signal transduction protein with EAL and GGDEF domain